MGLEQYAKAVQETAQNLRVIDDALFRLVAEREGVCQEILRTLPDMPGLRNCRKITYYIPCLFLRQHRGKISYIARYAPDFSAAPAKKNPADYR